MGILEYGSLLTAVCPCRPQTMKCNSQYPERVTIPPWTVVFLSLISNQAVPIKFPVHGSQKSWGSQSSQLASLTKSLRVKQTRARSLQLSTDTKQFVLILHPPLLGLGFHSYQQIILPPEIYKHRAIACAALEVWVAPAVTEITPRMTLHSPAAAARTRKGQHSLCTPGH